VSILTRRRKKRGVPELLVCFILVVWLGTSNLFEVPSEYNAHLELMCSRWAFSL
jgi:hypothetical protein